MTVFDIDPRLALPCVLVSHFLCAVTNFAVTPTAEPFDIIVGCNTFEGVAANYMRYLDGSSEVKLRQQKGVSRSRYIVTDAYASQLALADQFVHRGSSRGEYRRDLWRD